MDLSSKEQNALLGFNVITYEYFDSNNCKNSYQDSIYVDLCTTVNELNSFESNVSIYPNPTSGNSTISYSLSNTATVSIKMYDALGNLVKAILENKMQSGKNSYDIETSKLGSGIYFIELKIGETIINRKLIVQK